MRRFTLFMATLLAAVVAVAQENEPVGEYAYKEMASRKGDTLQVEPLVVTPSSMSKMEVIYRIQTDLRICEGDLIAGVTFKGYNPGQEQVRHLTVWLMNDNSIGLSNNFFSTDKMTKVFDGDCKILSGGTKDKPEDILHIAFDTSLSYLNGYNLRMVIMSQGVASGDSVLFLQSRGITAASMYATTGQNGQLGEPSRSVMPFAVFTIATPVKYVSGTVTDEDAKGVAGATVKLRGTQWEETIYEGVTDSEGKYRIRIEEGNKMYAPSATAPGHTCFSNVSDFSVEGNPTKNFTLYGSVTYPANQQSSIILPVAPDATVGRYYRLARREGKKFIFERERSPQANVPYVLFADRDYKVDLSGMDLTITPGRTKADDMLSLVGSYRNGDNEYANYIDRDLDTHSNTGRAMHAHLYGHYSLLLDDDYELVFVDSDTIAGNEYKPFIEDGKVWKFGILNCGNPMKVVDYYYFDGDTIIDGRTCKQMMCQRFVSPDYQHVELPSLSKVGAWYEENQKVYFYDEIRQSMKLKYDFTLEANDTLLINDYYPYEKYVIGPKQSEGIEGFKGVYRDIMFCADEGQNIHSTFWLEGIGGIDGLTVNAYNPTMYDPAQFLMACTVGDEVIFLNDEYEDGATPEGLGIFKKRFDFTHTTKLQPKAPIERENSDACISSSEREVARPKVKTPRRSDEEQSLYGEYNSKLLGINLDPLDDTYQVRIFNESGHAVYEKTVNAATIVGLSIDISDYAKGCYTVTVENSNELFTGEFETETTGIEETLYNKVETKTEIYNLQGQRLSSLQKGLNIVNGQKVYVK